MEMAGLRIRTANLSASETPLPTPRRNAAGRQSRILSLIGIGILVLLAWLAGAASVCPMSSSEAVRAVDVGVSSVADGRDPAEGDATSVRALRRWLETSAKDGEAQRRCAAAKASGKTHHFIHPLATFPIQSERRGIGQRLAVNLAAMAIAKDYAVSCGIRVTLMRMHHVDEPHPLPAGFIEAPRPLLRSTNDGHPQLKGKVPDYILVDEVLELVAASRAARRADFVVLTNADVMPYPDFYVKLDALLHTGPDTVQFTRMGVPHELQEEWPLDLSPTQRLLRAMSTDPAELVRHPGQDGFAFPISHIKCLEMGATHWGCAPYGGLVWHELARHSVSCAVKVRSFVDVANETDARFTMHLDHVPKGAKKHKGIGEANHPGVCNNKREHMKREIAARRNEAWLVEPTCSPAKRRGAKKRKRLCAKIWEDQRPKQLEINAATWWNGYVITSFVGRRFKRAEDYLRVGATGVDRLGPIDWEVGGVIAEVARNEADGLFGDR